MKNSLFIYTTCLLHRFFPIHWDQTMIIVCQSLGSRPILVQELFTLVPRLFGTTYRCLFIQPFQLIPSRNIWRHISLTWPFPHSLLMLRNCFLDSAVAHWFFCHATEPGFAGDIGAMEVWLIDWLIDKKWVMSVSLGPVPHCHKTLFCRSLCRSAQIRIWRWL